VEPNLQLHPYSNITFGFPSAPHLPYDFSHFSTSILTFLEAVEPNLKRHPNTNIGFGFPSYPYLPYDPFLPLYLHFNDFL